jgi:outer membrane protein assembly factor BamA
MKSLATSVGIAIMSGMLGSLASAPDQLPAPKFRTLGTIEFTGNKSFDQETLRKQLHLVRIGGPYDSGKLETDIDLNLKGFLKENGFMQCQTTWEERSLADGSVGIKINVVEGIQFRLAKLEIKGAKVFPAEEVTAQFHLRPGDVLNFAEVRRGLERIRQIYWDKGFIDFSYIPDQDINPASQTAGLVFTFEEGPRFRIAYVGIVGCGEQAEEDRVRAQIGLRPGRLSIQINPFALPKFLGKMGIVKVPVNLLRQF